VLLIYYPFVLMVTNCSLIYCAFFLQIKK